MTEDDLFPEPYDLDASPQSDPDDHFDEPFPELFYEDTFGYTFLADLEQQRDEIDSQIYEIKREAIERARAFIHEYKRKMSSLRLVRGDRSTQPCQRS